MSETVENKSSELADAQSQTGNELTDAQSQGLVDFLDKMGLPSKNVQKWLDLTKPPTYVGPWFFLKIQSFLTPQKF